MKRPSTGARKEFYWSSLRKEVKQFIRGSDLSKRVKIDNTMPSELLQPQTHITINFINGLPNSQGFNSLCVVMDMLTKYAHFTHLKKWLSCL